MHHTIVTEMTKICTRNLQSGLAEFTTSPNNDESGKQPLYPDGNQITTKILLFVHWPTANLP